MSNLTQEHIVSTVPDPREDVYSHDFVNLDIDEFNPSEIFLTVGSNGLEVLSVKLNRLDIVSLISALESIQVCMVSKQRLLEKRGEAPILLTADTVDILLGK